MMKFNVTSTCEQWYIAGAHGNEDEDDITENTYKSSSNTSVYIHIWVHENTNAC